MYIYICTHVDLYAYIYMHENLYAYKYTREFPPSVGFPSPSGEVAPSATRLARPGRSFPPPLAAVKQKKKKLGRPRRPMFRAPSVPLSGGTCGTHSFKNFRRVIRISNMCLVLKLDNEKVVSIANEQNHRRT